MKSLCYAECCLIRVDCRGSGIGVLVRLEVVFEMFESSGAESFSGADMGGWVVLAGTTRLVCISDGMMGSYISVVPFSSGWWE